MVDIENRVNDRQKKTSSNKVLPLQHTQSQKVLTVNPTLVKQNTVTPQRPTPIAEHAVQHQISINCKCQICKLQTDKINHLGSDYYLRDIFKQSESFVQNMITHEVHQKEILSGWAKTEITLGDSVKSMRFTDKMDLELKRLEKLKSLNAKASDYYKFKQIEFTQLLDLLSKSQKTKLYGCQVPIITTAIFKPISNTKTKFKKDQDPRSKEVLEKNRGNVRIRIVKCVGENQNKTQNNGCLTIVRQNLGPIEFKQQMKQQLFERNKALTTHMQKKMLHDSPTEGAAVFQEIQQMFKVHFQDNYIVRYVDGSDKIMSEQEAFAEWEVRLNEIYWQTVKLVQLTPGNKLGIGKSFCFCYQPQNFQLKDCTSDVVIKYDYKKFLTEQAKTEEELMIESPSLYCQMQCTKIGYYLKLVYNAELIKMNVEFHQDQNGQIWLFHAENIWLREMHDWAKNTEQIFSQFIFKEMKQAEQQKQMDEQVQSNDKSHRKPETGHNIDDEIANTLIHQMPKIQSRNSRASTMLELIHTKSAETLIQANIRNRVVEKKPLIQEQQQPAYETIQQKLEKVRSLYFVDYYDEQLIAPQPQTKCLVTQKYQVVDEIKKLTQLHKIHSFRQQQLQSQTQRKLKPVPRTANSTIGDEESDSEPNVITSLQQEYSQQTSWLQQKNLRKIPQQKSIIRNSYNLNTPDKLQRKVVTDNMTSLVRQGAESLDLADSVIISEAYQSKTPPVIPISQMYRSSSKNGSSIAQGYNMQQLTNRIKQNKMVNSLNEIQSAYIGNADAEGRSIGVRVQHRYLNNSESTAKIMGGQITQSIFSNYNK